MFWFALFLVHARDGDYAVAKIPATLLKNANVVKRMEEETFELKNAHEAYHTHHYVLTILNENGDKYATLSQHYNKFVDIRSIDGVLYDANGKELKKHVIEFWPSIYRYPMTFGCIQSRRLDELGDVILIATLTRSSFRKVSIGVING